MELSQFENIHFGKTAYILGNGPSLKGFDFEQLRDGVTFGTNRIYLSGYTPDYYVAVNPLVINQFWEEIDRLDCIKFLPRSAGRGGAMNVAEIQTDYTVPSFRNPLQEAIWEGHTVTYVCLQLAAAMDFSEIVLLGLDHYYGPRMQANLEIVATGPDEYHFDPGYFSNGSRWNTPDLANSELAYSLAKRKLAVRNVGIYNCSARTRCNVFEVRPWNYHKGLHTPTREKSPMVTAIVSAYDSKDFIVGCLEDLKKQVIREGPGLEVIVVCEMGSIDHTLASMYVGNFDGLKIITTLPGGDRPTIYQAWNLAIREARGKYLTNANTDDRHDPKAYIIMAAVLEGRPDLDVVYHDSYITWKPNQTFEEFKTESFGKELVVGRFQDEPGIFTWADYDRRTLGHGCFVGPQPMWRASLHQRYGEFQGSMISAGDYEFWLRVARENNMFHIHQALGLYCARMEGAELRNPVAAEEEARAAIQLHQEPELNIQNLPGGEYARFEMGNGWIFAKKADVIHLLEKGAG